MAFIEFNMTHREQSVGRLFLRYGGLIAWLLLASVALGCDNGEQDRYAYHTIRARGIFGETRRFTLTIAPGIVQECTGTVESSSLRACARASGPMPAMRVTNGTLEEASVLVSVDNLAAEAQWAVYLEPLFEQEPQDQRCLRDGVGPAPGQSIRLADATGAVIPTQIPACSALVFDAQVPALTANQDVQMMVLGGGSIRPSELTTALTMLSESDYQPNFIWFTDLLSLRNSADAFDALDEAMRDYGVPWGILMSEESLRRGPDRFVDTFGSLDFVVRVHGVPVLVLDTSDATISAAQNGFVQRIRTCERDACPPAIALMSVPPVSTNRLDVGMFRSQAVAQNLLSSLSLRGVRWLIAGVEKTTRETDFGRFRLVDTGRWAGVSDFLSVRIMPPSPDVRLCDGGLSLMTSGAISVTSTYLACDDDEVCVSGVCLPACASNADCASLGDSSCVSGVCRRPCNSSCATGRCDAQNLCNEGPGVALERPVIAP